MGAIQDNPNSNGIKKRYYRIYNGNIVSEFTDAQYAVDENGALKEGYQTREKQDGTTVYQQVFKGGLIGRITSLDYVDKDFGGGKKARFLEIVFSDGEEDSVLSIPMTTATGRFSQDAQAIADHLSVLDFGSAYRLQPYSFEDDKGRNRRGVTFYEQCPEGEVKVSGTSSFEMNRNKKPNPDQKKSFDGSMEWDWSKPNEWQWNEITKNIQRLSAFLLSSESQLPKATQPEVTQEQVSEMVGETSNTTEDALPWEV